MFGTSDFYDYSNDRFFGSKDGSPDVSLWIFKIFLRRVRCFCAPREGFSDGHFRYDLGTRKYSFLNVDDSERVFSHGEDGTWTFQHSSEILNYLKSTGSKCVVYDRCQSLRTFLQFRPYSLYDSWTDLICFFLVRTAGHWCYIGCYFSWNV